MAGVRFMLRFSHLLLSPWTSLPQWPHRLVQHAASRLALQAWGVSGVEEMALPSGTGGVEAGTAG